MPVEIGSLVINGTFADTSDEDGATRQLRDEVARMRHELREEMQDMIAEALRRREDR